jgi:hypothetical protein
MFSYRGTTLLPPSHHAFANNGCTDHLLKTNSPCIEKNATTVGIHVRLPNGSIITSTHAALLNLPSLPRTA